MTVLAAEAAAAFPIAAITPANTGTNTSMNSEAAESTSSVSRSAPDIAAVVIPAPARTPTAENTPDMFPPAPSAELRESAQSITTPHSDANSRSGSVSLSISMSRRNSSTPPNDRAAAPLLSGVIPPPSSISEASGGTASDSALFISPYSPEPSARALPHSRKAAAITAKIFARVSSILRIFRPFSSRSGFTQEAR